MPALQGHDPREQLFEACAAKLKAGDPDANRLLGELTAHTDYMPGWRLLGKTLYQLGRHEAAIVALDTALAAGPDDTTTILYKAEALIELGKLTEAETFLAPRQETTARPGAIAHSRGRIAYTDGRIEDARTHLERAISAEPGVANAWFRAGLVCHTLGDYADGAKRYDRAFELDRAMYEAALNGGICRQAMHQLDAAMHDYATAYKLEPKCLGRIAHALTTDSTGRLWLSFDGLAAELRRLAG